MRNSGTANQEILRFSGRFVIFHRFEITNKWLQFKVKWPLLGQCKKCALYRDSNKYYYKSNTYELK